MSRMSMIALAAALAVGSLSMTVDAQARGGHGGGHGAHFSGGPHGFGGARGFGHRGYYGVRHFGYYRGYRPYLYRPYLYAGYGGCYRLRRVWTAYGPVLRRVNVCYQPYLYGYY
jgi:hypothetical protein